MGRIIIFVSKQSISNYLKDLYRNTLNWDVALKSKNLGISVCKTGQKACLMLHLLPSTLVLMHCIPVQGITVLFLKFLNIFLNFSPGANPKNGMLYYL